MKHLITAISAVLAALLVAVACAAPPKKVSTPHRLGVTLDSGLTLTPNDAGVNVDEAGNPAYGLTTPVTMPFTGQVVTEVNPTSIYVDPHTCAALAYVTMGGQSQIVPFTLPTTCTAVHTAIKAAAAAQIDAGLQ